jgi:hypothetical protein
MPAILILHSGCPLAFHRACQNHGGLVRLLGLIKGVENLVEVVPIDGEDRPAEGGEAPGIGVQIVLEHRVLALSEPIDVHDGDEVVQPVIGGEGGGFPHGAFGGLAVAHQAVDPCRIAFPFQSQRHARRDRQPLPQRAGGDGMPCEAWRRMPLQIALEFAQRVQMLHGECARFCPCRIEQRRRMPFGEHDPIVARVLGLGRIGAQPVKKERRHQIGSRKAGGGMPRARFGGGSNRMDAQQVRLCSQRFSQLCLRRAHRYAPNTPIIPELSLHPDPGTTFTR